MTDISRPLPNLDELDTRDFWLATKHRELRYQRCGSCQTIVFHPRRHCTGCVNSDLEWLASEGRGTVYSYSIVRKSYHPFFRDKTPYTVAFIDLDEGLRLLSNVTGIGDPLTDVTIGMSVEVEWEEHEDLCIPLFKPASKREA